MRWMLVCAIASVGCLHDDLVTCGDQLCPAGSLCDTVAETCADPSGLSVPDGVVDLVVECGGSAMMTLPFRNIGTSSVDFEIAATVAGVVVTPSSATLGPGEEVDVQLVATAPVESIPNTPVIGDLLVAVNGGQPLGRPLQVTTSGAVVATSEQTLDFGESQVPATPLTRTFSIANTGNEDCEVDPTPLTAPYSLTSATSVDLAAGTTQTIAVAFQPPVTGSFDSTLGLAFTSNQCQTPPASIALSGVGTGNAILVDHNVLDFGTATCGSASVSLPLTFTNYDAAAQPLTFNLTNNPGFAYTVDVAPTLAAGPSTTTIMATRNLIAPPQQPGTLTATLAITAPALAVATDVSLTEFISAPQLSLSKTTLAYNNVFEGDGGQTAIQITNTGNAVANVTVSPSSMTYPGGTVLSFTPSSFQIPPNMTAMGTVTLGAGSEEISTTTLTFQLAAVGSCNGSQSLSVTFSIIQVPS